MRIGQKRFNALLNFLPARRGREGDAITHAVRLRRDFWRHPVHRKNIQSRRALAGESLVNFRFRKLVIQFQVYGFVVANDSESQRKSKGQSWLGVEAFGEMDRQGGTAEHPFKAAHQVVMAHQPESPAFTKTNSDLVEDHVLCPTRPMRTEE